MDESQADYWLGRHGPDEGLYDDGGPASILPDFGDYQPMLKTIKQKGALALSGITPMAVAALIGYYLLQAPPVPAEALQHPENWSALQERFYTVLTGYSLPSFAGLFALFIGTITYCLRTDNENRALLGMISMIVSGATLLAMIMTVGGAGYGNNDLEMDKLSETLHRYEQGSKKLLQENRELTRGNLIARGTVSKRHCDGEVLQEDSTFHCVGDDDQRHEFGSDWMGIDVLTGKEGIGLETVDRGEYDVVSDGGEGDGVFYHVTHISEAEYSLLKDDLDNLESDLIPLGHNGDLDATFALPARPR